MMDDEFHDKISGILFGTAIGDALGLNATSPERLPVHCLQRMWRRKR